jgi:hypothetical protein
MDKGRIAGALLLAALSLLLLAECVYFLLHGRFNIDEGLHLNAGRLIFEHGLLPYRDFPFSQGPGAPLFYGSGGALFGTSLLVGRCLSLLVSGVGVAAMMLFAFRIGGALSACSVVALTMVDLPAVWTYTQVRTEPPSIPLVVIATILLFTHKRSALGWSLAPSLLVWATSIRLTNGVVLLAICALVAYQLRGSPRILGRVAAIVLANGLVAGSLMLAFPTESFFHVFTSQLGRAERFDMADYPFSTRFWFFSDPHTRFRTLLLLCPLPLLALARQWRSGWRPGMPRAGDPASVVAWLIVMALLSYLPHLLFRIGFFHYFVTASVLLIGAIAVSLGVLGGGSRRSRAIVIALLVAAWAHGAWSSVQHLEKWVTPGEPTIGRFDDLSDQMREHSPGPCTMLTFETHIAVETRCDVEPGLEYSFFSFFPDLSTAEAKRRGVLNRSLLVSRVEDGRPDFVLLTRRAIDRIGGQARTDRSTREAGAQRLKEALRARYALLTSMRLPVGPVHEFQTRVYVYGRSDIAARAAGSFGPRPLFGPFRKLPRP